MVIGAGCSVEPPTSMPLARALSVSTNHRLELDGVLVKGECEDPQDLAKLTSLVFSKTGNQEDVVTRFPLNAFKAASPNNGYKLLVALMIERCISYVLSLNFDLAVQNSAAELGVCIEIVDGSGVPVPASPTLIHLHGNANSPSDRLVLREETIDTAWKNSWEQVVAHQVLAAPSLLFAGLGSAAPVLSQTIAMITEAVGGAKEVYQADTAPRDQSAFAAQLGVPAERYILGGWCAVMEALAARIAAGQTQSLRATGTRVLAENGNSVNEVASFCELADAHEGASLLTLGKLRAHAQLDLKASYRPRSEGEEELLVEPIVKLGAVCAIGGLSARPTAAGIWQLKRDGEAFATVLLASGRGIRKLAAVESAIRQTTRTMSDRGIPVPNLVLVAGTLQGGAATTDSVDLIADDDANDIVDGPSESLILETATPDFTDRVEQWLAA